MDLIGKMRELKFSEEKAVNILYFLIGVYVISFTCISFLMFYTFNYTDYDLAFFIQIVWNIVHGSVYSSILGIVFLGNHVQLIWFLIAPIYAIFPSPLTLLFLQSCALGFAAYPLYLLARKYLGYRWGLLVSSVYLIYPATGYINLYELHPTAFAVPFFFLMLYYFHKERFALYMLFLTLAVSCQENMALVAFTMGFYALLRRRKLKWIILPIVIFGIYIWFCLTKIIPRFNNNTSQFITLYGHLGNSYQEILSNIFQHPISTIKIILDKHRLIYLLDLFAPLSFISLFSPLSLFIALLFFLQHLLSNRLSQTAIYWQYSAEIIPFIFLAFVFGIKNLSKIALFKQYKYIFGVLLIVTAVGFNLYLGPHSNLLKMAAAISGQENYEIEKERLLSRIPKEAVVVSSFEFLPRLAQRKHLYSLHHIYKGTYTLSKVRYILDKKVDYALINFKDNFVFKNFFTPESTEYIQDFLSQHNLGAVEIFNDMVLFKRNQINATLLYKTFFKKPAIENKLSCTVGDSLELIGYDIRQLDDQINIDLYWQALGVIKEDLQVFFIIFDASDKYKKIAFKPICWRIHPTTDWKKGEFVLDRHFIPLDRRWLEKRYSLYLGICDYSSGKIMILSSNQKDRLTADNLSFRLF